MPQKGTTLEPMGTVYRIHPIRKLRLEASVSEMPTV